MKENNKQKSPSKSLHVVLWDGTVICEKNATETFIEVIRRFGAYEISNIPNLLVEGLPLVVNKKDYRMQLSKVDENWFVSTHMSTYGKKRTLEKIASILGKEISIILE